MQILDSTLREGELFRFLPAESRMRVASKIADSGVRLMEVTVDYPRRTSYEDNVGVVKALKDRGVEVVLHGRATQEDLSSMARYDAYGCAVYIAVSQLHREFKLHGITREAAVEQLVEAVSRARGLGFRYIRATMEDASRLFLQEGELGLDFVRTSAERLRSAGAPHQGAAPQRGRRGRSDLLSLRGGHRRVRKARACLPAATPSSGTLTLLRQAIGPKGGCLVADSSGAGQFRGAARSYALIR